MRRCVHCGCTEDRACSVLLSELDLTLVRRVFGTAPELLGTHMPCWWVSLDPPVCSAPACVRAHGADVILERVSRAGA